MSPRLSLNHAPEGDERIRTAVSDVTTPSVFNVRAVPWRSAWITILSLLLRKSNASHAGAGL